MLFLACFTSPLSSECMVQKDTNNNMFIGNCMKYSVMQYDYIQVLYLSIYTFYTKFTVRFGMSLFSTFDWNYNNTLEAARFCWDLKSNRITGRFEGEENIIKQLRINISSAVGICKPDRLLFRCHADKFRRHFNLHWLLGYLAFSCVVKCVCAKPKCVCVCKVHPGGLH